MGKGFKFGERNHFKRKQRMRLFNLNKSRAKQENKDKPESSEIIYEDFGAATDTVENVVSPNVDNENHLLIESMDGNNAGVDNNDNVTESIVVDENLYTDYCNGHEQDEEEEIEEDHNLDLNDSEEVDEIEIDQNSSSDGSDSSDDDDEDEEEEIEIQGRRIVDMGSFLEQLKRISCHNDGNCSFDGLKVQKEIRIGLHSKLIFCCTNCKASFRVYVNDDEKTTDTVCINTSAVLGANMIGIGYSQLEQFNSIIDVPTMCNDKFKKLNDKVGEFWEETAENCMREAAKEEALAAIERGDVDPVDGIPFITVVTDECWSKRAFNKNFTALSGVGAIVGAHSGKVLWIGVRNRYCVICVRNANKNLAPPPHCCTKNFTGPSSEMEWETILEGFKSSVELYNLRYMKVISDGDSSTYSKLLEHRPYQDRHIEKIECTNHLLRNFRKKIEAAVKGCPRGLNKHVCDNLERIRKDISCAIQFRKKENTNENEKISLLKSDLNNVLNHVFGDHANCPAYIKTFCSGDEDYVPALKQCNTFEKMSAAVRELMYCAKDLLKGETNNPAEHYNSIVAKFVGGKRVNFSLSNAYKYKAYAAAVQFNTRAPMSTLYNTKFDTIPPALTRKIELKRLQKSDREKERRRLMKINKIIRTPFCRVKRSGTGYGTHCQRADLSDQDFENEKIIHMEKLIRYHENRKLNEGETRIKQKSTIWNEIVRKILLSKDFGSICKARVLTCHVKELTQTKFAESRSMKHHNQSQSVAKDQLAKEQNISIRDCGLYIDDEHIFLAASPSGIVNDCDMIVDIQCPLAITNMDPNDPKVLEKLDFMAATNDNKSLELKKSHNIFYDIQGQLHICNKSICLFSIWTSNRYKMYVERIEKDDHFFETKMKSKLIHFYNDWLLPELVNPRLTRNMPIRIPT